MGTRRARLAGWLAGSLAAAFCTLGYGSCGNPGTPSTGAIRIELSDATSRALFAPDIVMDPDYYTVEGAGPGGASFSETVQGGASASIEGVGAGSWAITVTAFNEDDVAIGVGTGVAAVLGGQTASVTVAVLPISGTGSLSLTVTWPAEIDANRVVATLTPLPSGAAIDLDFGTASTSPASYAGTVQNGYYQLGIDLMNGGSVVATDGSNVVRIVTGQTSSGTVAFGSAQPLTVSLTASASSKNVMESVLLTATVTGDSSPTYQWRVDGSPVTGSASSYSFGSTWHSGSHEVAVIATSADGTRTGNATATIVVTAEGLTINHANFDPKDLSDGEVTAAAALDVYFEHASVGLDIAGNSDSDSSAGVDHNEGSDLCGLALLYARDPRYLCARSSLEGYSDAAWFSTHHGLQDNYRGNPGAAEKISGFQDRMTSAMAAVLDVATFKFCYIDSPADAAALFASARAAIEGLESAYPGVAFPWWTMPIQTSPNAQRQAYNDLVRSYCSANKKWLLDIADVESHYDASGDGADDSAATSGSYEILYSGYTSDGGHLNAAGAEKLAKAYWLIMAEIAKTR